MKIHGLCLTIIFTTYLFAITTGKISCPRGTRITSNSKCIKCRPGTFSSYINSKKCIKCPPGTYTPFYGVQVRRMCLPCPIDSTSSAGSSRCRKCKKGHVRLCPNKSKCLRCPPGTFINKQSCKCQRCEEDDFSAIYNSESCSSCSIDGLSPRQPQRDRCERYNCKDGYEHDGSTYCIPCEYNEYRNGSMSACTECPFGTVTNNFNGPNSKCIACPPGTYMSDYTPQTFTFEQVPLCADCPKGWTTNGYGKLLCHKPNSKLNERCPVNAFVDSEGDCTACGVNFRFDRENKKCVKCPKDSISNGGLQTECTKCPGDQEAFINHPSCSCPTGHELITLPNGAVRCSKCKTGTVNCQPCPAGFTTKRVLGDLTCVRCPPGTSTGEDPTGKSCRNPTKCPKGLLSAPAGRPAYFKEFTCVSRVSGCPKGSKLVQRGGKLFCQNPSTKQIICPFPKTQLFDRKNSCKSCRVDSFLQLNKSGVYVCVPCPENEVSNGGKATKCEKCKNGLSIIDSYPKRCRCPAGKFIDRDGKCKSCPKGTYNGNDGASKCQKCGKGFEGKPTDCLCPNNKVINLEGECVENNFNGPQYIR